MRSKTAVSSHSGFVRDQFTWVAYALLGTYAYVQAVPGPLMPFLRSELHLTYTLESLHMSLFALGMVFAGITGDYLARRWSRRRLFWTGAMGIATGAVLLMLAHQVFLALLGTFVMGGLGSLLLIAIQATLADHHGEQRTIALTEANIVATMGAGLAPLSLSGLVYLGWGWRGTLLFPLLAIAALAFFLRTLPIPEQQLSLQQQERVSPHLSRIFWLCWIVLVLGVSVEWCMVFWGADFLVTVVRLQRADAALSMSLFFFTAMVIRVVGSRLARRLSAQRLLCLFLCMALVGFPCLWFGPGPLLHIVGLCIAGAGAINLYPLALSVAVDQVPAQSDAASARCTGGAGLAILIAPLVLGTVADMLGLQLAFGVILVLILTAGGIMLLIRKISVQTRYLI